MCFEVVESRKYAAATSGNQEKRKTVEDGKTRSCREKGDANKTSVGSRNFTGRLKAKDRLSRGVETCTTAVGDRKLVDVGGVGLNWNWNLKLNTQNLVLAGSGLWYGTDG